MSVPQRLTMMLFLSALPFFAAAGKEPAEDWTQLVIPSADRSFNFKTVTKGTRPEHAFVLKNPFQEPIHIVSITSSCTCTTPVYDEKMTEIQTYDTVAVTAQFRADLFEGYKNATMTVLIDKPNRAEILLNVSGEIRADVKMQPESLFFNEIPLGEERSRELTVTYTGADSRWTIADVKSSSPFVKAEILPGENQAGKKIVRIKTVIAKTAPRGTLEERIFLVTGDRYGSKEIPVRVRATVGTVVTVKPQTLFLGTMPPGEPTQIKSVLLRGTKPFRITKIECDNPAVEITFDMNNDAPPKVLYPLPVRYKNPKDGAGSPKNGIMQAEVRILTDEPDLSPSFYVTMRTDEELSP
ncbi:MAG: DUF1573 domain-containing protein [Planctomycetaceae bacterium]|jgi:hypothetical protein|nr:DUF1573 domain-containing protein [Planctomycetaceae bacterium]